MAWGDAGRVGAMVAMILLAATGGTAHSAEGTSGSRQAAVASIDVTKTRTGLLVKGRVLALVAGQFKATMVITKGGLTGSAKTSQGGKKLDLAAGELGTIAEVGFSFTPGDTLDVRLDVTSAGAVVSEGRLLIH